MKLLVDNQLPLALAAHLRGWGLDCVHVREIELDRSTDADIWTRAIAADQEAIRADAPKAK